MNRKEIEEFIISFASSYEWSENNTSEQLRAFLRLGLFCFILMLIRLCVIAFY